MSKPALAILSVFVYLLVCIAIAFTTLNQKIIPDPKNPPEVHLGDVISMEIMQGDYAENKNYLLYLSDTALTGIKPQVTNANQKYILSFWLLRNSDSEKAWNAIFHQLKSWEPRLTTACVGPEDHSKALTCSSDGLRFKAISQGRFDAWLFLTAIALIFLIRAITSKESSMLRDWHPSEAPGPRPMTATYSLGRVQMAFWFVLVMLAFLFIWLITGDAPTVSTSTLALLGIGSGTALGAAVIDDSNKQSAPESKGFLSDLLTNADGYGFHRVQLFIWTIVLGVTFVTEVMVNLSMPDFDNTLLALMGISSGTYLGFKLPEKKSDAAPQSA